MGYLLVPPTSGIATSGFIALKWYPTENDLNLSNFRRPGAYLAKSTIIDTYFRTSVFFLVFRPGTFRPGTDGLFSAKSA